MENSSFRFRVRGPVEPVQPAAVGPTGVRTCATDNVFEVDGVTLMVDPKSFEYLDGMTLDFKNTLMEQAFVFHNPNATKSCGCGKSFMT